MMTTFFSNSAFSASSSAVGRRLSADATSLSSSCWGWVRTGSGSCFVVDDAVSTAAMARLACKLLPCSPSSAASDEGRCKCLVLLYVNAAETCTHHAEGRVGRQVRVCTDLGHRQRLRRSRCRHGCRRLCVQHLWSGDGQVQGVSKLGVWLPRLPTESD